MDVHRHLILESQNEVGLRAALGETDRYYSRRINIREGWHGYLFQGRFASYPMDDAHVAAVVATPCYVPGRPRRQLSQPSPENLCRPAAQSRKTPQGYSDCRRPKACHYHKRSVSVRPIVEISVRLGSVDKGDSQTA